MNLRNKGSKIPIYLIVFFVLGVYLFPIYWMFITSLRSISEIYSPTVSLFPRTIVLDNFIYILTNFRFFSYLKNSFIVSITTTFFAVLISLFTAYALSRFKFRGRTLLSTLLLVSQMLPPVLLLIPLFIILKKLGLISTHLGLTLTYITFILPFASWLLRGYFRTIPVDLENAALIDGCNRLQILFKILLPLSAPGVVAVACLCFVMSWQEYLYALTIMATERMITLPVGATLFMSQDEIMWGEAMAFSVLISLPVLIVFLFFQRYLVGGLTAGAVKG